jgi:hypothetical protein
MIHFGKVKIYIKEYSLMTKNSFIYEIKKARALLLQLIRGRVQLSDKSYVFPLHTTEMSKEKPINLWRASRKAVFSFGLYEPKYNSIGYYFSSKKIVEILSVDTVMRSDREGTHKEILVMSFSCIYCKEGQ